MTKASTFNLTEMKALFAAPPVLATEFADQFEKVFDQVAASLNVQDMVELILVRDFAIPSWELDRYTRHRTVAFDRKFKDTLEAQVQQLKTQRARREAYSARLAEHLVERPPEVAHLLELESKALEFVREHHLGLHSFRSMRRMDASLRKASALRLRHSQSLASLRHRPSQAKVRSMIQRFGSTTKHRARSERLTSSTFTRLRIVRSAPWKPAP